MQKVENFDLIFGCYYNKYLVEGYFLIVALAQNTMIV
jgi:hypothetical protein